jgi:hypothetical protein
MKILTNPRSITNHLIAKNISIKTFSDLHKIIHNKSTHPETRESFWKEELQELEWFNQPNRILDASNSPFYKWFPDGETNISHNCIDRHVNKNKDTNAIIWESAYLPGKNKIYTLPKCNGRGF